MNTGKLWDIFCKVIDNFGDIGVCWRLSQDLANRGERVRLWVDDPSALQWMAPHGHKSVEVHLWESPLSTERLTMGDVLIESFGCDIDPEFIAFYADSTRSDNTKGTWINLEYLTAETYAERSHGLRSPVTQGPGAGLSKHFFYPGFTHATGGLLREASLPSRQANFNRSDWLRQQSIPINSERLISLFCYEPSALSALMAQLAQGSTPTRLLVTAGRTSAAVTACIKQKNSENPLWNKDEVLTFSYLPSLTQQDFDHLLWSSDLNFVRGEDSLVRAIWARKPFIWHIYPQLDGAHESKLSAFLDLINAPPSLRTFHEVWNGSNGAELPILNLDQWQKTATELCDMQQTQSDLVTALIQFTAKNN
ncbi:elongation factor P maturation arginine rhamnosyltransferase EarP [Rhodoferax sp. PAMC 29310]|uniref:elongation factor P maturation arginine rhamnosyltransferase EarP n=1 Tax=Rhodoferax sp. PAMC 29310 TaxID=2822760 RepID=UPI001B33595C|nr:elongation factor P maturation arginine rhamnosyltransferase EarP [Rhodoferax sp. PAMC 29310]